MHWKRITAVAATVVLTVAVVVVSDVLTGELASRARR